MNGFGAVVMSFFAAVWCVVGLHAQESVPSWTYAVPIVISLVMFVVAARLIPKRVPPSEAAAKQAGRVLGIASGVEGVAMFVAGNALKMNGLEAYLPSAFAVIVGLHFFPIAKWAPYRPYWVTASVLTVAGVVSLAIGDAGVRSLVVGLVASMTLWVSSAVLLRG